ncbi:MAG: SGNH/GDSL hydrolase family protein [Dorea sp.]|nr:SGNH/GDSL hydrolase family protein [Dorea sp.]
MARNQRAENKKRKKYQKQSSEDKVLRMAIVLVVILFLAGAAVVGIKSMNPRPDITKGMEKLEALNKVKVSDVEKEVSALEEKEARELEERNKRPNSEKFENTLILGDFTAQGVYEQEVLGESFVLARESSCVHDPDGTGVTENLEAAAQKNPQVIFLLLGSNDAALEDGSAAIFEEEYAAFLNQVKDRLPDTKIYVNSILPVQQKAIEEAEGLADIPEYNERLRRVCEEAGVVFVDNSDLVKEDCYKDDGKRMRQRYYTAWIKRAVEVAEL